MEQFAGLKPNFLASASWHQDFEDALDQVKRNSKTPYDYVIVLPLDGADTSDAESIYERLTAVKKDAEALSGAGAVGIEKKEIDGYDCWCMFIKFTER